MSQKECDPNNCEFYGVGVCKLQGEFQFYIPGIDGVGLIELPHTSFYALQRAVEVLTMVKKIIGRVSGTFGGKPIFWISKKEDEVARIDWETGKPTRSRQYIITLTSQLSIGDLLANQAGGPTIEGVGAQPLLAPSIPQAPPEAPPEAPQEDTLEKLRSLIREKRLSGQELNTKWVGEYGDHWATNNKVVAKLIQELSQ